ncbi:hypothetical protein O3Q51_14335 [Cryomorphaceae bacterium 1068]|nr:hypothetical protein [Cryomorphaceae bacterium 1068]
MKKLLALLSSGILWIGVVSGQTSSGEELIVGTWIFSSQFYDSENTISIEDWPIEKLTFEENGFFKLETEAEVLTGRYEFVGTHIVFRDVSKNGIEQEGEEILFLSNLDSLTLTIQAKMENGILYIEYDKEED